MDGWNGERMGGRMDGLMDGMDGCINGWRVGWMEGGLNRWIIITIKFIYLLPCIDIRYRHTFKDAPIVADKFNTMTEAVIALG